MVTELTNWFNSSDVNQNGKLSHEEVVDGLKHLESIGEMEQSEVCLQDNMTNDTLFVGGLVEVSVDDFLNWAESHLDDRELAGQYSQCGGDNGNDNIGDDRGGNGGNHGGGNAGNHGGNTTDGDHGGNAGNHGGNTTDGDHGGNAGEDQMEEELRRFFKDADQDDNDHLTHKEVVGGLWGLVDSGEMDDESVCMFSGLLADTLFLDRHDVTLEDFLGFFRDNMATLDWEQASQTYSQCFENGGGDSKDDSYDDGYNDGYNDGWNDAGNNGGGGGGGDHEDEWEEELKRFFRDADLDDNEHLTHKEVVGGLESLVENGEMDEGTKCMFSGLSADTLFLDRHDVALEDFLGWFRDDLATLDWEQASQTYSQCFEGQHDGDDRGNGGDDTKQDVTDDLMNWFYESDKSGDDLLDAAEINAGLDQLEQDGKLPSAAVCVLRHLVADTLLTQMDQVDVKSFIQWAQEHVIDAEQADLMAKYPDCNL